MTPPLVFPRWYIRTLPPEERLMFAVLEDALREHWHLRRSGRHAGRRLGEIEAWLESDEGRHPFSFLNVCRVLGLDPGWIRDGLFGAQHAVMRHPSPATSSLEGLA